MSLSFTKRPSLKVDLDYTTRAWMKAKGRRSLTAYCWFARCRWSTETACVIDNTRKSGGERTMSRGILRQRENRTWWAWLQHGLYGVTGGDDCYLWWVSSIGTLSASSSPAGQLWISTDRRHQRHQGKRAPNWGKMIICAKHTHTRARASDTHNRSRCFPLFAAALYDKKRKMLLLSNYERPRRDKWLWIGWLVSATQPASVLPYVANDLCKVKKCLSKVLNNNTKNCTLFYPCDSHNPHCAPSVDQFWIR